MANVEDLSARLERLVRTSPAGKYRMGTPVTSASLARIEDQASAPLPEEYRAFLLAVGEGASGPVYGMLTLEASLKERGEVIYTLADPFEPPASTKDHLDFGVGGILPISYGGCAYFTALVVSGPERGHVWSNVEQRPGWVPVWHGALLAPNRKPFQWSDDYAALYDAALHPRNVGRRCGFAAWYAAWLDGEERAAGRGAS
jgi:hypothetical protein